MGKRKAMRKAKRRSSLLLGVLMRVIEISSQHSANSSQPKARIAESYR
jgi:hypothetical protein